LEARVRQGHITVPLLVAEDFQGFYLAIHTLYLPEAAVAPPEMEEQGALVVLVVLKMVFHPLVEQVDRRVQAHRPGD
jgi:hypothetical protein